MNYSRCNGMVYTVKAGDTLYSIGQEYGVPVWVLLRANENIDIYNLMIGTKLCVPMRCHCMNENWPEGLMPRDMRDDFD